MIADDAAVAQAKGGKGKGEQGKGGRKVGARDLWMAGQHSATAYAYAVDAGCFESDAEGQNQHLLLQRY